MGRSRVLAAAAVAAAACILITPGECAELDPDADAGPSCAAAPADSGQLQRELNEVTRNHSYVSVIFGQPLAEDASAQHVQDMKTACKSLMVSLLQAEAASTDALQQRLAHFCAYSAGGRGVFAHHQQWGSVYNPALRGVPVHPRPLADWPELEAALVGLEESLEDLSAEHAAAVARGVRNSSKEAYLVLRGTWVGIELLRQQREAPLPCRAVEFPKACAAVERFRAALPHCRGGCLRMPYPYHEAYELMSAVFNTLQPDTALIRHTSSDNQRIKVHCGIANPGQLALEIANTSLVWRAGRCELIDDSFEHFVTSGPEQTAPRVIFEVKLAHPDFETAPSVFDFAGYARRAKADASPPPREVAIERAAPGRERPPSSEGW